MQVSSVSAVSPVAPSTGATAPRAVGDDGAPFSDLMSRVLREINQPQLQAEQNVHSFLTGETDSVNDVVLSVAKADLTFRLFMEIRNRLISSYQEIQRMQV
ncbi:MAG: flagellar hook-basal body complex protein FliE [Planctomycetaceae bacterium]|nr:flagellar hook-basal body complex protein FliE [Planctomycetaceae bacterium]